MIIFQPLPSRTEAYAELLDRGGPYSEGKRSVPRLTQLVMVDMNRGHYVIRACKKNPASLGGETK